jgi:tetratricopeptide (TPR) repeat protein
MYLRSLSVLLLGATVFLGTARADDDVSTLMKKGRQAFKAGNFDDATRYHRLAAELAEKQGDIAGQGEALGDLGGISIAQGRYDEGKRLCLQSLGILRKTETKRYLPVVLNNLGLISAQSGDYAQAEVYYKEGLRVAAEVNPRDPYAARIHNNLGVFYFTLGEDSRAEKAFKNALGVLEKELGRERVELAPILGNLGGVYVSRKKWKEATSVFDRALLLLQRYPGSNQLDVAGLVENIGMMHYGRENFSQAEEAFRKVYEIRVRVFGSGHPNAATTALNLGGTLLAMGRYEEAERLLVDALKTCETTVGPRSHQTVTTMDKLAQLFRKTGREIEADQMSARVDALRFERDHTVPAEQLQ